VIAFSLKIYKNIQKYTKIYKNIQKYTKIYKNIQKCLACGYMVERPQDFRVNF
jgi:hypothetical protein